MSDSERESGSDDTVSFNVQVDLDDSDESSFSRYPWYDSDSSTELYAQYDREYERPQDMWYPDFWVVNPRHRMNALDRLRSRLAFGEEEPYLVAQPTTPRELRMRMRMFAIKICRCNERRFPGNGDNLFWLCHYHDWFGDWVHLQLHEYLHNEANYHRTMLSFVRWKVLLGIELRSYEFLFYRTNAITD